MLRQGEPQLRFLLAEIEKLKQDFPAYLELLRLLEEAAKKSKGGRTGIAESWAVKALELEAEAKIIRDSIRRTDEIAARFAAR